MPHSEQFVRRAVPVRADYIAQFQDEMVRVLPTLSEQEKNAFRLLDAQEQAWRFMNRQSRLVHPHPRQINKANGFDDLPAVQANRPGVEALLASLARGDDVNAHLSQDVMQGYYLHPPGRKDGRDFDLLLNEWGIHHLHLDQAPGKGGFRARTKELLYAILGRGVAFVLAVAPHRAWTSRRLIEVTVQSWPNQGLFVALNMLPGRGCSEDEHKGLRKVGSSTAAVVNDQCWISGVTSGMSTALVSNRVSRETGQLLRCLHQATEYPEHLYRQLMNAAVLNGVAWPKEPNIAVRWLRSPDRHCFGFVEEMSDTTLLIETTLGRSRG
ncbi:MAG: hypothetical protein ABSC06_31685 [Rhodopila sp.]|jgi:hypothetical protein